MHASLYLGARAGAAIINAVSIAIFTRMTSAETYGRYIIGFAICFIVYSLVVQWVVYAHFGRFRRDNAARLAGALVAITGGAALVGLCTIAAAAALNLVGTDIAIGCAALLICLSAYFAAVDLGRANLLVGAVTVATLTRSLFSLAFGCLALWQFNSPSALLIGIAIGHAAGALPVLVALRRSIWTSGFVWPTRAEIQGLFVYGWPLIIAFGASATAMNIDRILLESQFDAATVAPYGAALDFMKQSFIVVGEAIAIAYVSLAKSLHGDDDKGQADAILKRAFVTLCYIVVFGVVFFTLLGDPLFRLLLPPDYIEASVQLLPILVVAMALLVLRANYFGQVIYFTGSSMLEFAASLVMLAVAASASYLLIPSFAATGAAFGFAFGQAAALLVFLLGTPSAVRLPVDPPRAVILVLTGLAIVIMGEGIKFVAAPIAAVTLNLLLITAGSLYFLVRWNLFDARVIGGRLHAIVMQRLGGAKRAERPRRDRS